MYIYLYLYLYLSIYLYTYTYATYVQTCDLMSAAALGCGRSCRTSRSRRSSSSVGRRTPRQVSLTAARRARRRRSCPTLVTRPAVAKAARSRCRRMPSELPDSRRSSPRRSAHARVTCVSSSSMRHVHLRIVMRVSTDASAYHGTRRVRVRVRVCVCIYICI